MALEYFLYDTSFNNTLIERSNDSFTPLPPNTSEILVDYFIPNNQPLYYYREFSGGIILNTEDYIETYLNSNVDSTELNNISTVDITEKIKFSDSGYTNTEKKIGDFWFEGDELFVERISGTTSLMSEIGDLSSLQGSNDTTEGLTITWVNRALINKDLENDVDTIELNDVDNTKIDIKADGLYYIQVVSVLGSTSGSIDCRSQILMNGTTAVPGSYSNGILYSDEQHNVVSHSIVELNSGDYLNLQYQRENTGSGNIYNSTLIVIKLNGKKGDKGNIGKTGLDGLNGNTGFGMYAYAKTKADGTPEDSVLLSVNKIGTGVYDYMFENNTNDIFYGIFAQPFSTVTDTNSQISNVSLSGFTVSFGVGDNSSTPDVLTDAEHSVVVFGPPSILHESGVTWGQIIGNVVDQTDLNLELNNRINKVSGATNNNLPLLNNGSLVDSGVNLHDITGSSAIAGICELVDSVGNQELNNVTPLAILWGSQDVFDGDTYTHNVGTSPITVKKTGYYEISYNINSGNQTNSRSTTGIQFRWHGSTLIPKTLSANYTRNTANNDNHNSIPPSIYYMNNGEFLELVGFRLGDDNSTLTKTNSSFVKLKYLGV